ncbi:MAG TPA: tRNA uridine-5-carboxymethylaminomethyl(34) synthesis GTPase MnmE [Clostridiaceae bacterium]|nr:tRNA uridine-5-carboxymethylaminomethyl(34) synthesis GTPase MnmE [Clostridiaceae bacterium]
MYDAYAAIATPPGRSGIAVIRVSGPDAHAIGEQVFRFGPMTGERFSGHLCSDASSETMASRSVNDLSGYQAAFGYVVDPVTEEPIDEAVLLCFRAPHSFTGEDTVEISVHGGGEVRRQALGACLRAGARSAEPGEFSRNAFLNGKLDLAQAEAIMELIEADTSRSAEVALKQLQGDLSRIVRRILDTLYSIMSELELTIEYPEYEDSELDFPSVGRRIEQVQAELAELRGGYRQGRILRHGLTVALVGPPNVGKSSLLNRLSGEERSIVTDVPGTTRDTIELDIDLDGIPVRLIDTAGLRESNDPVERLGVMRTHATIAEADLIVGMIAPATEALDHTANWLRELPEDKPFVLVANKSDRTDFTDYFKQIRQTVLPQLTFSEIQTTCHAQVFGKSVAPIVMSTHEAGSLKPLKDYIVALYNHWGTPSEEAVLLTSERHYNALVKASDQLAFVTQDLAVLPLDILAQSLKAVAEQLALIIGDQVTDAVIDTVFSRFCVGK